MRIRFVGLVLAVTFVSACGGPSAEEQRAAAKEARLAARADSVAQAAAAYDAAAFDTIQWPSDNDMWERGGVVWSFSCQTCHGTDGQGKGETAVSAGLDMPNLVALDWELADNLPEIRRAIYIGHESEMPSWGLVGLKYRDIDAVSHYINDLLRRND
ncbi:MAG: c-type cytochrome [Gemmatimonadota bacterium]